MKKAAQSKPPLEYQDLLLELVGITNGNASGLARKHRAMGTGRHIGFIQQVINGQINLLLFIDKVTTG